MTPHALLASICALTAGCLPFRDEGVYRCVPPADAACTADCVCAVFPSAAGERVNALWGSGPNDLWAVGLLGGGRQAAHFNGTAWRRVALPSGAELMALWGNGASDVWAVGELGTVLRYDGAAWSKVDVPATGLLGSVSGTSASDVWVAVLGPPHLLRFSGAQWQPVALDKGTNLFAVLALGAADVWADGENWEFVFHFDGSTWRDVPVSDLQNTYGLFGRAPNDLWLAAARGLAHGDGRGFEKRLDTLAPLRAAWASGPDDVWAAGDEGQLWRGDGARFRRLASGVTSELRAVWGFGPGDVYVAGVHGVSRFRP